MAGTRRLISPAAGAAIGGRTRARALAARLACRWCLPLLLVALLGQPAVFAAANAAKPSLLFGIFPFFSPTRMEAIYGPLAAHLGHSLDRPVYFQSASSFEQFTARLAKGDFDVAFVNAFDYQTAAASGYLPVARPEHDMITWFLVRSDSPLARLEDLRGQVVALPPVPSANSRIGSYTLERAGLTPGRDVTIRHFESHQSCLHQVVLGDAATCATGRTPRLLAEAHYGMRFRLLHAAPSAPPPLFVAHQRLGSAERARIGSVLTRLRDTEDGRKIQEESGFSSFVRTDGAEYAALRDYPQARKAK